MREVRKGRTCEFQNTSRRQRSRITPSPLPDSGADKAYNAKAEGSGEERIDAEVGIVSQDCGRDWARLLCSV